jgi:glutaredoxin
MKMKVWSIWLLLLLAGTAQAQMFKWVDEKGVTHFSDTPPQAGNIKAQIKDYANPVADQVLPYALAQAVRNHPVTLYTTSACSACDQGRTLLQARGVPFSEKTVSSNEDQDVLRQAGGESQVPFLLVGRVKLLGFDASSWNGALSAASYPAQALLPGGYQNPQAESAAPRAPAPAPAVRTAAKPPPPPQPEKPATTPAIQF